MKSKITDSVYTANVPEVTNFSSEFVYNFYVEDERVTEFRQEFSQFNLDNIPRYVKLNWDPLPSSNYKLQVGTEPSRYRAQRCFVLKINIRRRVIVTHVFKHEFF